MSRLPGPLLTCATAELLHAARVRVDAWLEASFDLGRSTTRVELSPSEWRHAGDALPYPEPLRDRSVYRWDGSAYVPVQRYSGALIKLIPTDWGAPTFEIDGIKMLPTARVSPWEDARRKAELVAPRGLRVLDTCGGLGYYAAHCLALGAARVESFEKNPDVLWLRRINPWSPQPDEAESAGRFVLAQGDISERIHSLPDAAYGAVLHDPPRFGIAGELYSQIFYDQLARVLAPGGRLFHYTGAPNRLTSGRDVPREVIRRLQRAGFEAELALDGVLARKPGPGRRARPG